MDKRRNQTIEIALRYHTFEQPTLPWINCVITLQWQLNHAYYKATDSTPHEILFGIKLRGPVEHLVGAEAEQDIPFVKANVRHEASLALSFAAARAKEQYDTKYRPLLFEVKDNAYLYLH